MTLRLQAFLDAIAMDDRFVAVFFIVAGASLAGIVLASVTRSGNVPFLVGFNTMLPVTVVHLHAGDAGPARSAVILGFVVLYLARMNVALTFWYSSTAASRLGAGQPSASTHAMTVALTHTVGWLYCLPFAWAADRAGPLDGRDYAAIAVYALGTVFHFGSDYQKHRFKRSPGTRGKLLDTGFWGLSRHPNYFGDFLIYVSFAVLAGNAWGVLAPLANLAQYLGNSIPKSERMAAERYGRAWNDYRKRVRRFVPFIY